MTQILMKSGATEADIQNAINSLKSGDTLVLAKNEVVSIKSGFNIDVSARDITIDLNGSLLKQEANVGVIRAQGANDAARTVSLSETADGRSAVTFSSLPPAVKVGDWIKVVADDVLPGDRLDDGVTPTRLGEALKVVSVSGSTVTFEGKLHYAEKYVTNVRAAEINSGDLVIKNGSIVGDQPKGWTQPLVQIRNTIDAVVEDMTIRDGSSRAINIGNAVNTLVKDVVVKNMAASGFMTGTAVHSVSSTGTTVDGLYAERVNHATDNNAIGTAPNSSNAGAYGADIGMTVVNSAAYQTTNFAWTWHSEGLEGSFRNVAAIDSFGFMNARGIGGAMSDSVGVNNARGLMLFEHGQDDARGITLERVTMKETQSYALHIAGQPEGNRLIDTTLLGAHGGPVVAASVLALQNSVVGRPTGSVNETIVGTSSANILAGGAGLDTISSGSGHDTILGGHGADMLTGGSGRDRFVFHRLEEGGDTITDFLTGAQGDFIDLSVMASRLGWSRDINVLLSNRTVTLQQSGQDTLLLIDADGGGDNYVTLATLQNVLPRDVAPGQFILRMSDADTIRTVVQEAGAAAPAFSALMAPAVPALAPKTGGAGNDFFMANDAGEAFAGGAGLDRADYRNATAGLVIDMTNPSASTGAAAGDTFNSIENIVGSQFGDTIVGGDGDDYLYGLLGDDILIGGAGKDRLLGDGSADVLKGGDGDDELRGGDGDDLLIGGHGADILNGGAGTDTVSYVDAARGVTASIANTVASAGADEGSGDRFYGVEIVIGSRFDDVLIGDVRANRLEGGFGNDLLDGGNGIDVLTGGDGDDILVGGSGHDVLMGGSGSDTFTFTGRASYGDRIQDFESGVDRLAFTRAGLMISPDAAVSLVSGQGAMPQGIGPTFLFNTASGQLSFDADGAGRGSAAVIVAMLEADARVVLSDFLIA